ncbi:succinylglutamate desuccinylase/aspartoacylase family protein [Flagellimonas sp.]|uniref:succinylglutamate desuccinylase/aspartoacylase family protein n=1 Tax=Flagellimonas sp. TaxID=2058762 RepID=UPI003B5BC3F8
MPQIHSLQRKENVMTERVIGHLQGEYKGPTLVFFGGIHGNEQAGVVALKHVVKELRMHKTPIYGEIYAIAGNLRALEQNVRFQKEDLNRIWNSERISSIKSKNGECSAEEIEMLHLHNLLYQVLENENPPFYFIDLHTTSSDTSPFIVMNDSLLNRKFASNYPLPIILGIEEYLSGALLSFINEMGYVSLGYESGRHDDIKSVKNSIDFIHYTLAISGAFNLSNDEVKALRHKILKSSKVPNMFYEIYFQHEIGSGEDFKMLPGFINFQKITRGEKIAQQDGNMLMANRKRQIFMPLYQDQGGEGFYFIRPIPKIFLWASKGLRRFKADHVLVKLPGVKWASFKRDAMLVNLRTAKFLAKSIFHLLGYRARQLDETHMLVRNREAASKTEEYLNAAWFKNKRRGPH